MNLKEITHIYFLGAGGIGMSALIRYFLVQGVQVAGYDKTPSDLTDELMAEGAHLIFEDDVNHAQLFFVNCEESQSLIVFTPAIPDDLALKQWVLQSPIKTLKRAEILGLICAEHPTLAVAGTHGKTTTSTLLAHILVEAGMQPWAFLGGISANYNTNFLKGTENSWLVVEADEYDRSFLKLFPTISIITSTEADHLDIYGDGQEVINSFSDFAKQTKQTVIANDHTNLNVNSDSKVEHYGLVNIENSARKIEVRNGAFHFDLILNEHLINDTTLGMPGIHNIENAIAAALAASKIGVDDQLIKRALASFKGVKRRFEIIAQYPQMVYIDDYAHHPTELRACIESVRMLYPNRRITGIFQPHLFSRTRDFYDGFAESLDLLDEIILLDIYPAREMPIAGVSSAELLNKCKNKHKILLQKHEIVAYIETNKPSVLLTLGAGDIDRLVEPIKQAIDYQFSISNQIKQQL